jgi:hypothetical protein
MAQVLRIQNELINQGGDTTLSLVRDNATGMIYVTAPSTGRGWIPSVATPRFYGDPPPVTELLELRVEGSDADELADRVQDLMQYLGYITRSNDAKELMGSWTALEWQLDGETSARRCWLRDCSVEMISQANSEEIIGYQTVYQIALQRQPYWEDETLQALPDATLSAGPSALYDYTAAGASNGAAANDPAGDVPARISLIDVGPDDASAGDRLGDVWIGIRSDAISGAGNGAASYITTWEIEDGTLNGSATSDADATASDGTRVSWGNSTTATKIASVTYDDVDPGANYRITNMFGDHLWLMRASEDTTGTWYMQLRFGIGGWSDDEMIRGPWVKLDSTNWKLYEMGMASIPPSGPQSIWGDSALLSADDPDFEVQVWAYSASGSSDLYVDCLCPIPISEGYLIAKGLDLDDSTRYLAFREGPLGFVGVQAYDSGRTAYDDVPELHTWNFRLPPGDGRMVVAHQGASSQVIGSQVKMCQVTGSGYYIRWASLSGDE